MYISEGTKTTFTAVTADDCRAVSTLALTFGIFTFVLKACCNASDDGGTLFLLEPEGFL